MRIHTLSGAGLPISAIAYGCWGIGGYTPGATSYGHTDDAVSLRALRAAVDHGVTLFDTAPAYGAGHSEELLGEALAPVRDRVVIATKGGCEDFSTGFHFSPQSLTRALEGSLRRLRSDHVDLYQLHNPPPEVIADGAIWDLLDGWRRQGRIRAIGISVRTPEDGLAALAASPATLQVNFNLADQRALSLGLLDRAAAAGVAVLARTPLCFGLLAATADQPPVFGPDDHRSRWSAEQIALWIKASNLFLERLSMRTGQSRAQLALRYCLSHPAVAAVIPGMANEGEVAENTMVGDAEPLPQAELDAIRDIYAHNEFFIR